MRARTGLWLGLLLLITVVTWLASRSKTDSRGEPREQHARISGTPAPPVAPASSASPEAVQRSRNLLEGRDRVAPSSTTPLATPAAPAAADAPPRSDAELVAALDEVRLMIRDYHTALGENPIGTNAEIMQAINGHNAKQAKIGPPAGQTMNEKGELVDRWGTPYFFHQISGTEMEVRSAGPDRVMGTPDDRQVK